MLARGVTAETLEHLYLMKSRGSYRPVTQQQITEISRENLCSFPLILPLFSPWFLFDLSKSLWIQSSLRPVPVCCAVEIKRKTETSSC